MDKELVERLARDAGGATGWDSQPRNDPELRNTDFVFCRAELERFAALIVEECVEACETADCFVNDWSGMRRATEAIRAKFGGQ